MSQDCPSQYCYYYGKYELCHCVRASRSRSAATVQECRAYRKLMEDLKTNSGESYEKDEGTSSRTGEAN